MGDRQATVLAHGNKESNRALPWWRTQLVANGMESIALSPDPAGFGAVALTRGALFTLAMKPGAIDTDEGLLALFWHVVWWGSGSKHFRVAPKIRSFADPTDRRSHLRRLREAVSAAQDGELTEAYELLQPGREAAKLAVGAWIEDRYNRRRRHSSIGQISPVTFEMQQCNQTAAVQRAA